MDAYEYIEEYLSGKLSVEQQAAFEKELSADAELRAIVENYGQIKTVSDRLLEEKLLGEVVGVSESLEDPTAYIDRGKSGTKAKVNMWKWYIVGIGLLAIALYLLNSRKDNENSHFSPTNYIADAYRPPLWPATRGGDTDFAALGVQEFKNKRKLVAEAYLLDSLNDVAVGNYWLAELYLSDANYKAVLAHLPEFDKEELYYNRANYVRFLALIGTSEINEASKALENLSIEYKSSLPSLEIE